MRGRGAGCPPSPAQPMAASAVQASGAEKPELPGEAAWLWVGRWQVASVWLFCVFNIFTKNKALSYPSCH